MTGLAVHGGAVGKQAHRCFIVSSYPSSKPEQVKHQPSCGCAVLLFVESGLLVAVLMGGER